MTYIKKCLTLLLAFGLFFQVIPFSNVTAQDLTTKYRVYQNDSLLKEFSSLNQAKNYANSFSNSYVEDVTTREWVYSNFPQFEVIANGNPLQKKYNSYDEALQEAQKHDKAIIKNLHKTGIVWNNFPNFVLYQGDKTLPEWTFETLEEAKKEASKWGNTHIIDLQSNEWVWDNVSQEKKEEFRNQDPIYEITAPSLEKSIKSSYLEDAISEALKIEDSLIVNTKTKQEVYSNVKTIIVKQSDRIINAFYHLDQAIPFAKNFVRTSIEHHGKEIWFNDPNYEVLQQDNSLKKFNTIQEALQFALSEEQTKIIDRRGKLLWDNSSRLTFWGWNGTSNRATIMGHVDQAVGLDVDSPTWFKLSNATGEFEDTSDAETVKLLHEKGIEVHPLVHNQFDGKLTSAFLADEAAQNKFINDLINKSVKIGVDGLNIDFESVYASDRDAYTAFVQKITDAAHKNNLIISIDLPRGSVAWNHKTAYDHEALAKIVDYIMIMAYDQHWSGSEVAGSVSGLQWAEQGIEEFLSYGISRDQLILGIPFYIREWKFDSNGNLVGNRAIYSYAVEDLLKENEYTSTWDERFNQYKIEYHKDGFTYVFWLEDEKTVEARLELAKKYSLGGVAAWRLGQEPASFWNTIIQTK
ncbi:glycosyl hydrolase family 18 protein [Chengkuizengella axinellae]|uniref:Glycosyl hydrolase family 18 protein n=1 Tax=Chengkuizengella axinellae TaxID=3064388 RepID=A0ABT9J6D6_9BACL|nr:glycosyl hydrolase family 18 protein [Chengkuizengella sp. 2205SS18-9]MDP5277033.1 glycosyl hydrolase family 18 protein [Chengkuizengella sp. 2205SS18-9]